MIQRFLKAMNKNKKGFTLVELMVVVVIIGVLVAIAVPVYNGVTTNAATNANAANLRTIDGAIMTWQAAGHEGATPDEDDLVPDYLQKWPTPPTGFSAYEIIAKSATQGAHAENAN